MQHDALDFIYLPPHAVLDFENMSSSNLEKGHIISDAVFHIDEWMN